MRRACGHNTDHSASVHQICPRRMLTTLVMGAVTQIPLYSVSATASFMSSSEPMFSFYCVGGRADKPMCKHHNLIMWQSAVNNTAKRKAISDEVKGIITSARRQSGNLSPFSKDYSEMKMLFCATNPPDSKILCASAASSYGRAAGSRSSKVEAMEWYCANPSADPQVCKRVELVKKMRDAVGVEEKKSLAVQLKQYPSITPDTTRAVYADFCKLKMRVDTPLCSSLQMSARIAVLRSESEAMKKWYCEQPGKADGLWCKGSRLQKLIPKSKLGVAKTTGSWSSSTALSDEITAAKKLYCRSTNYLDLDYCKRQPLSGSFCTTLGCFPVTEVPTM